MKLMRMMLTVFVLMLLVVPVLSGFNFSTGQSTKKAKARTWVNMNLETNPGIKICQGMTYDSESDKIIMFGGFDGKVMCDETWTYDYNTNTWENRTPPASPPGRCGVTLIYDAKRDICLMFGGINTAQKTYSDTWKYDYNTNTWTNLNPKNSPSARAKGYLAYDSESDQLVYFGGYGDNKVLLAETWTYSYSENTWTNRTSGTQPSARQRCHMYYDSKSDRIIMFGGWLGGDEVLDDTWAYDCNTYTWTKMQPAASPHARARNGFVYIPEWDFLFCTHGFGGTDGDLNDTWTYDYDTNTWTELTPETTATPAGRHCFNIAYDSKSHVILCYGGSNAVQSFTDTWTFGIPPPEKEDQGENNALPQPVIIAILLVTIVLVLIIIFVGMKKKARASKEQAERTEEKKTKPEGPKYMRP